MIQLKNVSKWYGSFQVLNDCSTSIQKGEVVVVCGPSGSGKSTLIRCINRLETVQKGRIEVDGIDLTAGGKPQAIPLTGLLNIERRHGKDEFVIEKALVKMDSAAMKFFESRRADWAADDLFASPGPRQLWGPVAHQQPISVALNSNSDSLAFKIG